MQNYSERQTASASFPNFLPTPRQIVIKSIATSVTSSASSLAVDETIQAGLLQANWTQMETSANDQATITLQDQLRRSFQQAQHSKTPVLTHLNADTSWLLSLAYPDQISPPTGRSQYNILVDPWLDGPQEDYYSWFSKQSHLHPSSVRSVTTLNQILHDAEGSDLNLTEDSEKGSCSFVDAVVISHEFTDHCHRLTLLEVHRAVPVFATTKAAQLIRTWQHFDSVVEIPPFAPGTDWRTTSHPSLPSWIGISRLVTSSDALYYHSAIVLCTQQPGNLEEVANALIYTPHGVEASSLSVMATASPRVNVLALLHGLHDVSLKWSKQLNLGAVNAVRAQKILRAKYWIGTHDEQKPGSGLIAPLLRRKILTVQEAVTQVEAAEKGAVGSDDGVTAELNCVELENGQSMLLD